MASMVACIPLTCWVGGDSAKCSEECAIHSSGIIQEDAHDLLDAFGVGGIKKWGSARWVGELHFGTLFGLLPGIQGILSLCRWWMAEAQECTFDVARHGEINHAVDVIPNNGEAAVASGSPIFADLVVLL